MVYVGLIERPSEGMLYARVTTERDCLPPDATDVIAYPNGSVEGTAELYTWAGFDVDTEGE